MKHLEKFKLFEYRTGDKIKIRWSAEDVTILMYYVRFGFDKIGVDSEEIFVNKYIGTNYDSFIMQSQNMRFLFTDGEEGLPNYSKTIAKTYYKYRGYSEIEFREVVENILDNISEEDIEQNIKRVDDSIDRKEERKEKKAKEQKEKDEMRKIMSKHGNVKRLQDIETESSFQVDDLVNHKKFGEGMVKSISNKIIEVEFEDGIKKVLNNPDFFILYP